MTSENFEELLKAARSCQICKDALPFEPRPLLQLHPDARILIAGQAPGLRGHESRQPFNDLSGDRLRNWLGIERETFYDSKKIALMPMGFCFPGTGKSGDLPPRPECEPAWRKRLLAQIPKIELTLVIGQYAQAWHIGEARKKNLTETVKSWCDYWPYVLPLPHPSPRNVAWFSKNPWFDGEILPPLRKRVQSLICIDQA